MTEPWESAVILTDQSGDPIPQIWDPATNTFKPFIGSTKEYGPWLSTDAAPTLPATDRALGVEINTSTGVMTLKYWNGSSWEDVA